jgi:hypothetical protein
MFTFHNQHVLLSLFAPVQVYTYQLSIFRNSVITQKRVSDKHEFEWYHKFWLLSILKIVTDKYHYSKV